MKSIIWTEEEITQVKNLYFQNFGIAKIGKIIGRAERTVAKLILKLGIKKDPWKGYTLNEISSSYKSGKTISQISRETGILQSTIKYALASTGVWKYKGVRKYNANFNFFKNIDSEQKSYWLGFIAADGNVYRNALHIGVHRSDKSHLITFKNDINASNPIRDRNYKNKGKASLMSIIEIIHPNIVKDLAKHGIYPSKTKTLEWTAVTSNIPQNLLRHFIRGYFDGDGSWAKGRPGQIAFKIASGSKCHFLDGLQKEIANSCNLNINSITKNKSNGAYYLEYGGHRQLSRIYKWMYDNASVFLKRKQEKSFTFLEKYL